MTLTAGTRTDGFSMKEKYFNRYSHCFYVLSASLENIVE